MNNREELNLDDTVLVFFETLAHMERQRIIDPNLVKTTFVVDISGYWQATKHYIMHVRKQFCDDRFFEEMEKLSDRLWREYTALNCESKIGAPGDTVRQFLEWEAHRVE